MSKKADLILGAGERCADIRYATGLSTPDEFFYFAVDGVGYAVLSPLEFDRARHTAKPGVRVLSSTEFESPDPVAQLGVLAEKHRIGEFRVPADFPVLTADALRARQIKVTPEPGCFFPVRAIKSEWEIAEIRRGVAAAAAGARRAFAVLRESDIAADRRLMWHGEILTSEILRREVDLAQLALGALPAGTIVAGGAQGAEPHNTGSGPLFADSPIVLDIFPRLLDTGYWGDLTRTVVRGHASDVVRRAFEAVREARDHAKKQIRAGADPRELHRSAAGLMADRGFPTVAGRDGSRGFFHGLGHGLGLDIHEAPRLSPSGNAPLAVGEVVTVEPGLYYPEWGGIRLEDVMVVREDGGECLTELETELEIN